MFWLASNCAPFLRVVGGTTWTLFIAFFISPPTSFVYKYMMPQNEENKSRPFPCSFVRCAQLYGVVVSPLTLREHRMGQCSFCLACATFTPPYQTIHTWAMRAAWTELPKWYICILLMVCNPSHWQPLHIYWSLLLMRKYRIHDRLKNIHYCFRSAIIACMK